MSMPVVDYVIACRQRWGQISSQELRSRKSSADRVSEKTSRLDWKLSSFHILLAVLGYRILGLVVFMFGVLTWTFLIVL